MTFILTALGFLKRVPWQLWAAIGVALLLWRVYEAGYDSAQDKCDVRMAAYVASVEAAQVKAGEAQQAVNDAAQARYQELAERAQNNERTVQDFASTDTDAFVNSGGMWPAPDSGAPSRANSTPTSDGAGISTSVPTGIIVGEADVRTCASLYAYAVSAHDWAAGLQWRE